MVPWNQRLKKEELMKGRAYKTLTGQSVSGFVLSLLLLLFLLFQHAALSASITSMHLIRTEVTGNQPTDAANWTA